MKNKYVVPLVITLIGSFLSGWFGPWWAPAAFIIIVSALIPLSTKMAALIGFITLAMVYLGMALWMNTKDEADIIGKTGLLLGGLPPFAMIALTACIGGISGVLSGWLGNALGKLLREKKT